MRLGNQEQKDETKQNKQNNRREEERDEGEERAGIEFEYEHLFLLPRCHFNYGNNFLFSSLLLFLFAKENPLCIYAFIRAERRSNEIKNRN